MSKHAFVIGYPDSQTGIENLRAMVALFNWCRESFLDQFSVEQLCALYRAYLASGWTILPDQWTPRQVADALRGVVPQWDDNEQPVYNEH